MNPYEGIIEEYRLREKLLVLTKEDIDYLSNDKMRLRMSEDSSPIAQGMLKKWRMVDQIPYQEDIPPDNILEILERIKNDQ